jgi:hypothetical protein
MALIELPIEMTTKSAARALDDRVKNSCRLGRDASSKADRSGFFGTEDASPVRAGSKRGSWSRRREDASSALVLWRQKFHGVQTQ